MSTPAPSTTSTNPINPSFYYRLTNAYLGTSQSLDVVNDGTNSGKLKMADSGNFSGQFWHFALLNNDSNHPKYALRTQFRGEGFSLDVVNDAGTNSRSLHLAATGNFSGQFWTVTPWNDGTSTYRLTNDFTGPNFHLDTYADTHEPFLGVDNHTGQHWLFEEIGDFKA